MKEYENGALLERALSYLPYDVAAAVRKIASSGREINEIRIVSDSDVRVVASGNVISTGIRMRRSDVTTTFRYICGNSVYSHTESVKEGYVVTSEGIRAGVCGRAVTDSERIVGVADVSCVVMRIPSRRAGFADELYSYLLKKDFRENVLVVAPPGGGKTTLLRELAAKMSTDERFLRVCVVDTRHEITEGLERHHLCAMLGYPRAKGIEIAVRTLSPDVIICDEISTDEEISAAERAAGCGASLVASCHGDAAKGGALSLGRITDPALFTTVYAIERHGDVFSGHITERGG